jgi:hypothetical protein
LLDFELTERGTFRLSQFGEQTAPEIVKRAYPVLSKALEAETFVEHAIVDKTESVNYGSEAAEVLRKAAAAERKRLRDVPRTSATTELGKRLQREVGGSGAFIDAVVEQAASKRLRQHKTPKHVKPS